MTGSAVPAAATCRLRACHHCAMSRSEQHQNVVHSSEPKSCVGTKIGGLALISWHTRALLYSIFKSRGCIKFNFNQFGGRGPLSYGMEGLCACASCELEVSNSMDLCTIDETFFSIQEGSFVSTLLSN